MRAAEAYRWKSSFVLFAMICCKAYRVIEVYSDLL